MSCRELEKRGKGGGISYKGRMILLSLKGRDRKSGGELLRYDLNMTDEGILIITQQGAGGQTQVGCLDD